MFCDPRDLLFLSYVFPTRRSSGLAFYYVENRVFLLNFVIDYIKTGILLLNPVMPDRGGAVGRAGCPAFRAGPSISKTEPDLSWSFRYEIPSTAAPLVAASAGHRWRSSV